MSTPEQIRSIAVSQTECFLAEGGPIHPAVRLAASTFVNRARYWEAVDAYHKAQKECFDAFCTALS